MKSPEVEFRRQSVPFTFHMTEMPDSAAPLQSDIPVCVTAGLSRWMPENLPFFCRIEHQMGKKMPVQFKFRLGSVEYVDALEGKR